MERRQLSWQRGSSGAAPSPAISQLAFLADPQLYYAYFTSLFMAGARLSGDITPAYALLQPKVLAAFKARLEQMGITLKVLYLVRNPLTRLISSLRQQQRSQGLPSRTLEQEVALLSSGWEAIPEGVRRRGAYHHTLATLRQVFAPEQLHLELFEELFSPEATARLCQTLQMPWQPPDLETRWQSTGASLDHLPQALQRQLAEAQRQPMGACLEAFGQPRLQANWPELCNLLGYGDGGVDT